MARTALRRRWVAAKAILGQVRPAGVAGVVLTVALTVLSAWRDEWPADKQPPLLSDVLGWLPWWAWLLIALALALALLFEGAHREIWRLRKLTGAEPEEGPSSTAVVEKGILDFLPDGTEAMKTFTSELQKVARSTANIGPKLGRHANRFQQAAGNPTRMRKVAIDAANDMNKHSAILDTSVPVLRDCGNTFGESYVSYFEAVGATQIELARPKVMEFRRQIANMIEASRTSREGGVAAYRDSVVGLRQKKLSQAVNQAADRLQIGLDAIIAIMKDVEQSCKRLLTIIDGRLNPTTKPASRKAKTRGQ
jgi:hypothetical protein